MKYTELMLFNGFLVVPINVLVAYFLCKLPEALASCIIYAASSGYSRITVIELRVASQVVTEEASM